MNMPKVLSDFAEGTHFYKVGDSYPVEGVEASQERLEYLSDASKNGAVAFIEKVAEKKDERYDKYNIDELKKLLADSEIDFTGVTKKADLFDLAVNGELI